jgi:Holliday junction DNA helicase RuvA
MISRLEGKIVYVQEKSVVLDVGGMGYKVQLKPDAASGLALGQKISLWTHLVVREDALELFGFLEKDELDFFEILIGISGIGPKSAIGILSLTTIDVLKKAIASGDTSYLTKISGIGKKTAEKIVLELGDKLRAQGHEAQGKDFREEMDALEALKSLGYSPQEARDALKKVDLEIKDVSERVKEALKILSAN